MTYQTYATLTAALLLNVTAMAQFSTSSALDLESGENSYPSTREVYWRYTSPTDNATLMELAPINGSTLTAYLGNGILPAQTQVMEYFDSRYYLLVGPEETVYVSAHGGYGAAGAASGFDASLAVSTNLGLGFVPDFPIVIEDGGQYMVSNGTTSTVDTELHRYFYYEPAEAGTLTFGASTYLSLRYANRYATEMQVVTGRYVTDDRMYHYDIPVNPDEPILLLAEVQAGNVCLVRPTLMKQGAGDGSKPASAFVLTDDNYVPQHFGTYWYRYDAHQTGYVTLSSDASMPGGTVNYYGSSTGYMEYASRQGTFDIRFAVTEGMSYYLSIDKVETTTDETPFHLTYTPVMPGDTYHDPIVVEFDADGKAVATTPAYSHQTYNFAVDMEGPDDVFELKVRCSTPASQIAPYSQLIVYPYGNMMYGSGQLYGGAAMNAGTTLITDWTLAQGNGSTVPAGRYFIYVEKYEYEPLTFIIERAAVEEGDVLEAPIILSSTGIHDIPAKDIVYYQYTAPRSGNLVLTLDDPQLSATFYRDGNPVSAVRHGLEYKVKTERGETWAFSIAGGGEGLYTFSLVMCDFAEGEAIDIPIHVTGDIVLGEEEVDAWYEYVVQSHGIMLLTADLTDRDASVGYILNHQAGQRPVETSIISGISDSSDLLYRAEFPVEVGDVIALHVRTQLPQPGLGVQFMVRGYEQGESLDNPYLLTEDAPLRGFLRASRVQPIYVRIPVRQGEIRLWSELYTQGILYTDASLQQMVGAFASSNVDYKGHLMCFYLDATVNEEADYYLVLTDGGGENAALLLEYRTDQAITEVGLDCRVDAECYDLMGRHIDANRSHHGLMVRDGKKLRFAIE